ncbi:MAG: flagellar basal body P-ring formation chaperone FlgA [Candidatus Adiutrix sp.]|jgi:flagella basal body P-ring formation protein FlgA|nr:flagellar basal body P-ring formation chaperone FlgA [Candidatus Adiutrix sp.]
MTGKRPNFIICQALLLFLSLLGPAPLTAAWVSVTVPPENSVSGARLLLGDIAAIEVLNPAGSQLAEALAGIDLGPAPAAGQEIVLRRSQLERRLSASRLNLAEASWSLPVELRLTGRGQELSQDLLRQALAEYLAETEPYRSGRYEIVSANFGALPTLPPGRAAYRFAPQPSSNPAYLSGAFLFAVDGRELARSRVTAQIELSLPALVAARSLPKGQVLTEDDLSLSLIPYAQARGALQDQALAVGSTLRANLNPGDPIRERHLSKSVMIRRGETVSLIARQGGLKVSATGQAKQDGALGETITLLNLDSKKTVSGRVIGPSQVEIVF